MNCFSKLKKIDEVRVVQAAKNIPHHIDASTAPFSTPVSSATLSAGKDAPAPVTSGDGSLRCDLGAEIDRLAPCDHQHN